MADNSWQPDIIEIPIRADMVVRIHGIPFDLARPEAEKIANVVIAHAAFKREEKR